MLPGWHGTPSRRSGVRDRDEAWFGSAFATRMIVHLEVGAMKSRCVGVALLCAIGLALALGGKATADDPRAKETPDQRFEKLLADAMKTPEKTDWKSLREAFSRTSHYQPYNIEVDQKLKEIAKSIGRGETKESETALVKLIERDRFMRFDSLAMLIILYDKTDQPEKGERYRKILDGILGVLKYPEAGTSYEKPIQILFIQEEYLVATSMPIKGQALQVRNGHRFDLLTIKARGDEPEKTLYFDIDLTRNARSILDR